MNIYWITPAKKEKKMSNKTEIVCVLDRSGSMEVMKEEAIGGFNAFLKEQKKVDGEANITVCLFDHDYNLLYDGLDLKDAKPLDSTTYVPRGTTALLDAIGRTVDAVQERIENLPSEEQPEKVIMAILTDGMENASKDYNNEKIRTMVESARKEKNWEVFYLAANQDAFETGAKMGMTQSCSFNYSSQAGGTSKAYGNMSRSITSSRMNNGK